MDFGYPVWFLLCNIWEKINKPETLMIEWTNQNIVSEVQIIYKSNKYWKIGTKQTNQKDTM